MHAGVIPRLLRVVLQTVCSFTPRHTRCEVTRDATIVRCMERKARISGLVRWNSFSCLSLFLFVGFVVRTSRPIDPLSSPFSPSCALSHARARYMYNPSGSNVATLVLAEHVTAPLRAEVPLALCSFKNVRESCRIHMPVSEGRGKLGG